MPILKQLVSSSVHSKRRSRMDLTAEMISAPLGDFRHTMHVGRAGDAFGDTSFLNSKAGEPDGESLDEQASASSSKRSLLSRKFRGSKRSQSVTRGDREQRDMLGSLRDSALFVKNAMSLPQLNEKEAAERGSSKLPKSLSSSPVKKGSAGESDVQERGAREGLPHRNGAGGPHSPDPILDEQAFGDLTDLPVVPKASYGLKHAESIMSFHIDLGPSMLGDVLSIMDKDEWEPEEEEDGGYHGNEGPSSLAAPAPLPTSAALPLARQEAKAGLDSSSLPPHALEDEGWAAAAPSPGSARSVGSHTTRDTSSLSSCASGVLEERSPAFRGPDRARATLPRQPDKEFSFMDEEEDEIHV
ncbi:cdc42 effector protein 4 [Orycteropus afer afer]|uniref:Cdc42 effector protein 4 n=1 Tax=Orycteropus afer afer TaxID=1230840 RepID=A0A8B7BD48_ORYAF|nr:cdc42 effector protein 4 [Orycteropus afer afer]